jgi:hypothetical protein
MSDDVKVARDFFPEIMCRGCGQHGLSIDQAKLHFECRDVPDNTKELYCAMCGEEFFELTDPKRDQFVKAEYARKKFRKGPKVYAHKFEHVTRRDHVDGSGILVKGPR